MRQIHPGGAYGRIGHLPGSRRTPDDIGSADALSLSCLRGPLPAGARLYVLEKLDGTCVAAWRRGGEILALGRQGDLAGLSQNPARRLWAEWVKRNAGRLRGILEDGERLVGEWMALAHGVRYALPHGPFVAFDLMRGPGREAFRLPRAELLARAGRIGLPVVGCVAERPAGAEEVLARLGAGMHGAIGAPEGLIYRLEPARGPIRLAKYVRADHLPGALLPENTGGPPIWNTWTMNPRPPDPRQEPEMLDDAITPPDFGSFEAHLTVEAGVDRAAFAAWCAGRGLRCVDIELARGDHPSQPMTASVHRGGLDGVLAELRALAADLRAEGFGVTRLKVEALGDHPLAPETDAEGAAAPADRYFEFHLKLLLPDGADLGPLTALSLQHGAHLSRNARKRLDRGEHRFLTMRAQGCGRRTAEARFRALVMAAQDLGFQAVSAAREYTVYDSRAALDDGWLPSANPGDPA